MRALRPLYAPLGLLALAALACSLPFQVVPTPTPAAQADGSPTALSADDTPPSATEPPPAATEPTPTEERDCTLDADFVADVSVPDGTTMEPGIEFVKTWRVQNGGTCDWDAQTELVFTGGDQMNGPDAAPIGAVNPGSEVDLSLSLEAPEMPGTYRGDWQLETADGERFGPGLYVEIVVPEPTPEPTATMEPTPTVTETLEATETPMGTAEACVTPYPDLEHVLEVAQDRGYRVGCPTAEGYAIEENDASGAVQAFWANVDEPNPSFHYRSLMIWRADTDQIYVVDSIHTPEASEGELMIYSDTWDDSQPHVPPDCADVTVPEGYQLPERGFGKVWCEEGLMDAVGWPDEPESQADLLAQPTENGLLVRVAASDETYLIALLLESGEAIATWPRP